VTEIVYSFTFHAFIAFVWHQ